MMLNAQPQYKGSNRVRRPPVFCWMRQYQTEEEKKAPLLMQTRQSEINKQMNEMLNEVSLHTE
jgi:hypothetical protein